MENVEINFTIDASKNLEHPNFRRAQNIIENAMQRIFEPVKYMNFKLSEPQKMHYFLIDEMLEQMPPQFRLLANTIYIHPQDHRDLFEAVREVTNIYKTVEDFTVWRGLEFVIDESTLIGSLYITHNSFK